MTNRSILRILAVLVVLAGLFFAALFGFIISDPSWMESREALTGQGTKMKTWIGFLVAIIATITGLAYLVRSFTNKTSNT